MKEPAGPGIRHDCGVYSGWTVPTNYDPILSKLIAWGPDRASSINRMVKALNDFPVLGISTTVEFLAHVLQHEAFGAGETYTDFINLYFPGGKLLEQKTDGLELALSAAVIVDSTNETGSSSAGTEQRSYDVWNAVGNWELGRGIYNR